MNLKPEELVKALRCCAEGECSGCPMYADKQRCQEQTLASSADQIEHDQKEIAELKAKVEQLSDAYPVVGDSEEGHDMNEPLTLQELVELNGQPVWMGEPFNQWTTISIDPKYIQGITPGMKIRKGAMNANGERVEIPPVDFYRYPPKEEP